MSTSGKTRATPRVVCCAIPIARAHNQVLVITSRKRPNNWVCECRVNLRFRSCSVGLVPPMLLCRLGYFMSSTDFSRSFAVPKGGWEPSDMVLEAAAVREALEEGLTLLPSTRLLIS